MNTILAIDKGTATYDRGAANRRVHGMNALHVDTMEEAVNLLLAREDDFIFIVINEDTIPDFMSKLRIMRAVTSLPIFVATSSYTIVKEVQANDCGADVYDHFKAYAKNNIIGALASFTTRNRRVKRSSMQKIPVNC